VTDSDNLFDWLQSCSGDGLTGAGNKIRRRNGAVTLVDAGGTPVRSWKFADAYPVKWTGPRLSASSRDLAVEELEVCHSGFRAGD
jgi:phage tail-like protein